MSCSAYSPLGPPFVVEPCAGSTPKFNGFDFLPHLVA
jgi:hypothetical protein